MTPGPLMGREAADELNVKCFSHAWCTAKLKGRQLMLFSLISVEGTVKGLPLRRSTMMEQKTRGKGIV